jgi:uncharacterized membrane protein
MTLRHLACADTLTSRTAPAIDSVITMMAIMLLCMDRFPPFGSRSVPLNCRNRALLMRAAVVGSVHGASGKS